MPNDQEIITIPKAELERVRAAFELVNKALFAEDDDPNRYTDCRGSKCREARCIACFDDGPLKAFEKRINAFEIGRDALATLDRLTDTQRLLGEKGKRG